MNSRNYSSPRAGLNPLALEMQRIQNENRNLLRNSIIKLSLYLLALIAALGGLITLFIFFNNIMIMLLSAPVAYGLINPLLANANTIQEQPGRSFFQQLRLHFYNYRYSYLLSSLCLALAGGIIALSYFIPFVFTATLVSHIVIGGAQLIISPLLTEQQQSYPEDQRLWSKIKVHFKNHRNQYIILSVSVVVAAGVSALSFFFPYVLAACIAGFSIYQGINLWNLCSDKYFFKNDHTPSWAKYGSIAICVCLIAVVAALCFATPLAPFTSSAAIFVIHSASSSALGSFLSVLGFTVGGFSIGALYKGIAKGLTKLGEFCSKNSISFQEERNTDLRLIQTENQFSNLITNQLNKSDQPTQWNTGFFKKEQENRAEQDSQISLLSEPEFSSHELEDEEAMHSIRLSG